MMSLTHLFNVIGLSKHWHMLCIHHRMIRQGGVVVTIKAIWDHLQSLYDLASLVSHMIITRSMI